MDASHPGVSTSIDKLFDKTLTHVTFDPAHTNWQEGAEGKLASAGWNWEELLELQNPMGNYYWPVG